MRRKGGETVKVYCDNKGCEYNESLMCTQNMVYYVKRKCMTYRSARRERTDKLMQPQNRSGCKHSKGHYVSDRVRIIK